MKFSEINDDKISCIALGAANFGTSVAKETSFGLMDKFLSCGGNLIDTGRAYCYWLENGANASESVIGEYIKSRNNRHNIFLSSKGGHPPIPHFEISRINEIELTKDIDESLQFLKTDYLDVFFLHRDDVNKPVSEIMPILDKFIKAGKTRYIGASNWSYERIAEANHFAVNNGFTQFRFSQIMWSYAQINANAVPDKTQVVMNEKEYACYLKDESVVPIAYSSQAQGFFSLANQFGIDDLPERYKALYINAVNMNRIAETGELAEKYGISPTSAGLARLLQNELHPITLIGAQNAEFLNDSLQSIKLL